MTSGFVNVARVYASIRFRSVPAQSGAPEMAHMEKCVRDSTGVRPLLPTSSISGSFQLLGAVKAACKALDSKLWTIDFQATRFGSKLMSPVVRHSCAIPGAHSHGCSSPHEQTYNSIGRPVLRMASAMRR